MEPIKMTVRVANEVYTALQNIDVYTKIIKGEDGTEKIVSLPYKLSGKARWNFTRCLNRLKEIHEDLVASRDAIIKEVTEGKATIDGEERDKLAAFNAKMEEVLSQEIDTKGLLRVKVSDLNLDENQIPVAVLHLLTPILDDSE